MTQDPHQTQQRIQSVLQKYEDTELFTEFNDYLSIQLPTTGNEHHHRFLRNLKVLYEHNQENGEPVNLTDLEKQDMKKLLSWIENTAWRENHVSGKTKNKYRATVKKLLGMQGKEWTDLAPEGVTVYQKEEKNMTDPDKIPNPEEVAKIIRNIENRSKNRTALRNAAFFTTLWDTGVRVGALINAPKHKVTVKTDTVEIEIPGIKDSPTRKLECFFAAPILKRWLENHPSENSDFLFCSINQNRGNQLSYRRMNQLIKETYKELEEDNEIDVSWKGQPLHIFRKSMKTWFDNMDILDETDLDIRAGHKHGSEATRRYTRKSDEDQNRAMRQGLGLEDEEDRDWKQFMWPKKCSGCSTVNTGFRGTCYSCGKVLDKEAYPETVETETPDFSQYDEEELREALQAFRKLEEEGVI